KKARQNLFTTLPLVVSPSLPCACGVASLIHPSSPPLTHPASASLDSVQVTSTGHREAAGSAVGKKERRKRRAVRPCCSPRQRSGGGARIDGHDEAQSSLFPQLPSHPILQHEVTYPFPQLFFFLR
uniref:Uncharacterized protein n=1 Tax=Aegilops tauschii subsp. strangulata TaxID=200361 RepID=A0A452YK37_AEGTS